MQTKSPLKDRFKVMLKRDLTDEESLLRTFGDGTEVKEEKVEEEKKDGEEEKAEIDLDMKKKFYYVLSPNCEVVDCAKIYSFLHENNIFRRVTAKVSKHVD